ncbi:MAG: tetratricopeptide repeat protein [Phenylobacterium sp.]|uniref:tetratricopeptide repeat protein n=1 Tax=Phenylobacterium sp. TaxID=1871053 RepID=UPI0025E2786B|nr:tetratricopeptide repeat protein [Phenylobacterium sp.]MBI1198321.1 tetratricopeptide repeat protein [Phenylobacterium sp.]
MSFLGGGLLYLLLSLAMAVHVVRTGRPYWWLLIILLLPFGSLIYALAIVAPELFGGVRAQRFAAETRAVLDPGREYREAKRACDETPTVRNQSRLAAAAAGLGHHAEAEALYREAAQGVHAEDPSLLLGRAQALLELGRPAEALEVLDLIPGGETVDPFSPPAVLALARAYDALGRTAEAEAAFVEASERMAGFEGLARHAAFLAHTGRTAEAREMVADMDRRIGKIPGPLRAEARHWRDLAARALSAG